MAKRFVLEGEWSGYTAAQRRIVHREVVTGRRVDALKKLRTIQYSDGTQLTISVRGAEPREKVHEIHSYGELIRQAEAARKSLLYITCPVCGAALQKTEFAGQFHHPHWNSFTLRPGLTVEESRIAQKIEQAARAIAAEKIMSRDPSGLRLPDDIWTQGIPHAVAKLEIEHLNAEDRGTIERAAASLTASFAAQQAQS